VVGPPVPADEAHRRRVRRLNTDLALVSEERAAPFVDLMTPIEADARWLDEPAAGDGYHPGTVGYRTMADVIRPAFTAWTAIVAGLDDR